MNSETPARVRKLNLGLGLWLFGIVALTALVFYVSASEVTSRTDTLSNQTKSQSSSHKIVFTLTGGNTFAASESIILDFHEDEGRFVIDGASTTTSDVSLNDGTARTIYSVTNGSADCTGSVGVNDVAVGIDDTNGIVTLTACSSFTASGAGSTLTIGIGQDAGGTNRITNPSTADAYVVDITDAAGDCVSVGDKCDMAIPIVDSGLVTITASVTAVCGNSIVEAGEQCDDGNTTPGDGCSATCQNEGGGGPPADTTPPIITNVAVSSITKNSATVTWDTNESASSIVNYGLTASYGSQVSNTSLLLGHSMNLTSLSEATTYHYQVCSADGSGNQSCSSDATFVTLDQTPPVISSVVVSGITTTQATFTWTTNENSDSHVDYQTTAGPPYASTQGDASMVTSHSVTVTGLSASTTYHYRVRSIDASTNESFTTDASFSTASPPDTTAPVISGVAVTNITTTSARITWTTNEAADSKVDYGTTVSYGLLTTDASLVTSHTIDLTGLTAGTQYHFRVRSADAAANEGSSTDATFTTLPPPDVTPPVISNIVVSAITGTGATISWTTNEQATQFVDYDTDGSPYASTSGSATPLQTSHSVILTGLTSQTQYHYSVRSADAALNSSSSTDATFTTKDITPPTISNVQATSITSTGATITWTTSENADSKVDYDIDSGVPYAGLKTDAASVTSHSVVLTGLTAGTQYYYRVRSSDPSANQGTSSQFTFTTLPPPDVTPPVISSVQVTGLTSTGATITWTTNETSDSRVDYGTTAAYGSNKTDATMVTSHSITLTGLSENTTYHYKVTSKDAATNSASSSDATFKTIDATAPAISNVQVTAITETSATITWNTNENANSNVDFDLVAGPPYGLTQSNAPYVTSHSVTLTGLSANTLYHFRVRSVDPESNSSASGDSSFTTIDTTAPVISAIVVSNITSTGAKVTWTTNEASDSILEYGPTASYGSTSSNPAQVTSHSITLSSLSPVTTYHFRVKSKDASNNLATSTDQTFITTAPPPPVISNIQVSAITQTAATITWTTDISSDSKVEYGTTVSYGNTKANATTVTSHTINLTNLVKNTTYHYKVSSKDQYGQTTTSVNKTFVTAADTTPPANVTGLSATAGVNSVALNWTNPVDPDFVDVRVVRKSGSAPTGPMDGTTIYTGSGTSKTDTGLTNDVIYYYAVYAYDDVGNASSGAFANATPTGPPDTTPPPDISGFTATPGNQTIQLTWTKPVDADWAAVKIRRKTGGYPTNKDDGTLVYDGNGTSKLDTGRTNGTTYYYRAFSYDGALNYTNGVDAFATPSAPPDTTAPGPVTSFVASPGDTQVQLSWVNPTDTDYAGTRVLRKTGSFPISQTDGTIVFEGTSNSKLDSGVTNDTTYYYALFTFDTTGNWSGAVTGTATPEAGAIYVPPSCTDSDGGKNYVLQGTVTAGASNYADVCASQSNLIENFCDAGFSAQVEIYDCGEGYKCSAGKCVADTDIVPTEVCGNGICAGAENSLNCPIDCPVESIEEEVVIEEPTVTEDERLGLEDLIFYAANKKLRLDLINASNLNTFANMSITAYLADSVIPKPVKSAFVNFNGKAYAMRQTASYETTFLTPSLLNRFQLSAVVNYEDGTSDSLNYDIDIRSFGLVYEMKDGQRVPVQGARVTLLEDTGGSNFGLTEETKYGQQNPQVTNESGLYGFIVPSGTYKLKAEKDGYRTKEKIRFPLLGNLVQIDMELIPLPPEKIESVQDAVEQAQYAAKAATEDVREVIQNEFVEEATSNVATPTVAAVAVANVASAGAATATAIPYMMYLYSFLAQPTLLIARRRRKKWGTVFNAITKIPVDLAIVRLLDAKTGKIIRSAVTDKDGRYFFIAPEGTYKLSVAKSGFVFPTDYMKDEKVGPKYGEIYHGEEITAKKGVAITVNIPVDPVEKAKTPTRVVWAGIGRRFQKSIGILTIVAMAIAVIINPTTFVIGMLIGNIVLYVIFRRLSIGKPPKNWGVVYDKNTGKPIRNAIVRIFESKYNKLLETQVTGARGRYAFLVGSNVYYVTYEKPGYQKTQQGPVDLVEVQKEEDQLVALDVKLDRRGGAPIEAAEEVEEEKETKPKEEGPQKTAKEEKKGSLLVGPGTKKPEKKSLLVGPGSKKETTEEKAPSNGPAPVEKAEEKKDVPWELKMLQKMDKVDGTASDAAPVSEPKSAGADVVAESDWEAEMMKELGGDVNVVSQTPEEKKAIEHKKDLDEMRKDMAEESDEQLAATSAVGVVSESDGDGENKAWEQELVEKMKGESAPTDDKSAADTEWEAKMLGNLQDVSPTEKQAQESGIDGDVTELEKIFKEGLEEMKTDNSTDDTNMTDTPSVAGSATPEEQKLIQDVERAHPETKLIESEDKAHPDEGTGTVPDVDKPEEDKL